MARTAHLEAEALGACTQCSWSPAAGRAVKNGCMVAGEAKEKTQRPGGKAAQCVGLPWNAVNSG